MVEERKEKRRAPNNGGEQKNHGVVYAPPASIIRGNDPPEFYTEYTLLYTRIFQIYSEY